MQSAELKLRRRDRKSSKLALLLRVEAIPIHLGPFDTTGPGFPDFP